MNPQDNIEKLITELVLPGTKAADQRILNDALAAYGKSETKKTAKHQPIVWRLIMNKPITKLATAAAVILIVVLGITILDHSVTPAYAIEQTIKAFKKVDSVYVEQIIREKGTLLNIKMWARKGRDGNFFFGDFRLESGDYGDTTVVNESENHTYYYNPSTNKVYIYEGLNVTIGSFLDVNYYVHLQEKMEDVKIEYDKDKITGKKVALLTYKVPIQSKYDQSHTKSEVITFDLETKLPIRSTSWDNPDLKGEPWSEWTLIKYNPELPEDTFKFEIPEDATVIRE